MFKSPSQWCVQGLWGSAKAYFLSQVARKRKQSQLIVCAGRREAEEWVENLSTCLADANLSQPLILEGWELPVVPTRPSLENASEHSAAIEHLLNAKGPSTIVATLSGVLQFVLTRERYRTMRMEIKCGDSLSIPEITRNLVHWGYERTPVVEKKGDFSVHGGIVDIYPVVSSNPLRVELVGDEVESLRFFDAMSQRSRQNVKSAVIHAANEWAALRDGEGKVSVLDFLDRETLIVLDEPQELLAMDARTKSQDGLLPMRRMAFPEFLRKIRPFAAAGFSELPQTLVGWEKATLLCMQSQLIEMALDEAKVLQMSPAGSLSRDALGLLSQARRWVEEGYRGTLVFRNEAEEKRFFQWCKEQEELKPWLKQLDRIHGGMALGFISASMKNFYLTDRDFFGRTKVRRSVKRFHGTSPLGQFLEMNVGDYVVHQRHGIGRFLGIQHITRVGVPGEYLSIEYANSAKLHVPLDQAYLVQKYLGVGDRPIQIDQLGSTRWEKTKARVLAATLLVAKDLLEVQAARKSLEGIPYSEDTPWQRDFENAFPYEETPDQITSIEQVKKDMTGPHPMDRLLCGDVGYGKTEVAIRAAFKAVMDQRQVAVLVPTTILAQQHLSTFQGRMADYPVRVEMLSRFRHPGQVRKILLDLVEGKIDVIIGTHRLLQGDVQFKDLGLVIIDEEQRFGVGHKEKLKKLRTLVDVLTMTATPIPRTLYLSLLGTKEMSTINTPPQDRLPVDTMLCEYDERLIRRAIRYELAREGQVFFVHNRVRTIEEMGRRVRRLVPEAKVVCAHGQMGEDLLSDIMSKFVTGQIDVLVTTTIIESGLDIPNANTLIVDRADRFGLSELYQLRGRVGRFKNKAYAYFLLPKDQVLLMSAKKRLKAIADFTALGSGFKIAMRDLEIRGAGNILGHQQHGHIAAVGFDLYCQLLKQSVTRLKSMPLPADQEVTVKIGQPLTIPADYVPSEGMRMDLYRRISAAHQEGEVQALREEILDRFGALPSSVELYLDVADIRILARSKGVFHSEAKNGKWFLRRGKDLITVNGKLPEQHAKNAKEAATELKNVLKKLPDEVRMNGLERSVHEKTL